MHSNDGVTRRTFLALAAGAVANGVLYAKAAAPVPASEGAISLAGEWRFHLDRENRGLGEKWFARPLEGDLAIALPGILQTQGYGDPITAETPFVSGLPHNMDWTRLPQYEPYTRPGHVKMPFLAQPVRHYIGVAWYQREIHIPADWRGRRVELMLERTRWETSVFLDDRPLGRCHTLVAPHEYDLGILEPGSYQLSIRVDTSMLLPYRPDGHSVSDAEGGTWNGIVGRIELTSTPPVWIREIQVYPNVRMKTASVHVMLGNVSGRHGSGILTAGSKRHAVEWDESGGAATIEIDCTHTPLWDEFSPHLERLKVELIGNGIRHHRTVVFGMREVHVEGKQMLINGELLHIRGTHDAGGFPLTGYPATDIATWKKLLLTSREWGFNAIRFHSWCPPEAAFSAADELGFYLQPDCGMWNAFDTEGRMLATLNEETERLLRAYGNHPSMILLNASNEPAGHYNEQLPLWDRKWKQADPRRLYADGTGRPSVPAPGQPYASDYVVHSRSPLSPRPGRGPSGWFGEDYEDVVHDVPVPLVAHEIGQWCAYPDFSIIEKFKGYMQPSSYEVWRDSAKAGGVLEQNRDFTHASGRFQLACYKEEIEANLRTPSYSGYELLDIHDYLGQGGAPIGMLDAFWENKGYAQPGEYRRFNQPTVLLARLKSRVFRSPQALHAPVEVAHFGPEPMHNAAACWSIVDAKRTPILSGSWPARDIPRGKGTVLGAVDVELTPLATPAAYTLRVELEADPTVSNEWTFWVYPTEIPTLSADSILHTTRWDEAETALTAGHRVLFTPGPETLSTDTPRLSTVPIFWNRLMNPGGAWMLGLLIDATHPALAGFPTDTHCDWQWIDIATNAPALRIADLPDALRPIVQPIDDWNRNWKLALIFECSAGSGRLLVSTLDLQSTHAGTPTLRSSLLRYMASEDFAPKVKIDLPALRSTFTVKPGTVAPTQVPAHSQDLDDPGQIVRKHPH